MSLLSYSELFPTNIYLLKVNNRNYRKRCEICSKLTMKTAELRQRRLSGVFIVNFEHITPFSSVSIVHLEQIILNWGYVLS